MLSAVANARRRTLEAPPATSSTRSCRATCAGAAPRAPASCAGPAPPCRRRLRGAGPRGRSGSLRSRRTSVATLELAPPPPPPRPGAGRGGGGGGAAAAVAGGEPAAGRLHGRLRGGRRPPAPGLAPPRPAPPPSRARHRHLPLPSALSVRPAPPRAPPRPASRPAARPLAGPGGAGGRAGGIQTLHHALLQASGPGGAQPPGAVGSRSSTGPPSRRPRSRPRSTTRPAPGPLGGAGGGGGAGADRGGGSAGAGRTFTSLDAAIAHFAAAAGATDAAAPPRPRRRPGPGAGPGGGPRGRRGEADDAEALRAAGGAGGDEGGGGRGGGGVRKASALSRSGAGSRTLSKASRGSSGGGGAGLNPRTLALHEALLREARPPPAPSPVRPADPAQGGAPAAAAAALAEGGEGKRGKKKGAGGKKKKEGEGRREARGAPRRRARKASLSSDRPPRPRPSSHSSSHSSSSSSSGSSSSGSSSGSSSSSSSSSSGASGRRAGGAAGRARRGSGAALAEREEDEAEVLLCVGRPRLSDGVRRRSNRAAPADERPAPPEAPPAPPGRARQCGQRDAAGKGPAGRRGSTIFATGRHTLQLGGGGGGPRGALVRRPSAEAAGEAPDLEAGPSAPPRPASKAGEGAAPRRGSKEGAGAGAGAGDGEESFDEEREEQLAAEAKAAVEERERAEAQAKAEAVQGRKRDHMRELRVRYMGIAIFILCFAALNITSAFYLWDGASFVSPELYSAGVRRWRAAEAAFLAREAVLDDGNVAPRGALLAALAAAVDELVVRHEALKYSNASLGVKTPGAARYGPQTDLLYRPACLRAPPAACGEASPPGSGFPTGATGLGRYSAAEAVAAGSGLDVLVYAFAGAARSALADLRAATPLRYDPAAPPTPRAPSAPPPPTAPTPRGGQGAGGPRAAPRRRPAPHRPPRRPRRRRPGPRGRPAASLAFVRKAGLEDLPDGLRTSIGLIAREAEARLALVRICHFIVQPADFVILVVIYVVFFKPVLQRLKVECNRTNQVLMMIPRNVILEVKFLSTFFTADDTPE
eukprot:tig00001376_g8520.t1